MNHQPPGTKRKSDPLAVANWIFLGVFIVALTVSGFKTANLLSIRSDTPETILILLATATTLVSLSRQLPGQTVALAAIIVAVIGSVSHSLGALVEIPFGRFAYTDQAGPQFFHTLPWAIPFIWIIVVLNSRGVARLILRPWRKTRIYGFWLIGLTAVLTLLFDLGLEPFATRVKHYWLWSPSKLSFDWYGAPVTNFIGWTVTALLIMAFVTPTLTKKKPAKAPSDYTPLVIWVSLNALFIIAASAHQLWLAAGFSALVSVAVIIFTVRGARW
jgi:putative membrane protein